jgi:Family of unknown function (DUF5994)
MFVLRRNVSGDAAAASGRNLASPSPAPRLRLEPIASIHTLLDGAWWPRTTNPIAELPGLVLAIDTLRGLVTDLVLSTDGWDSHPRRLVVAGRSLRLGYFASQPTTLFTAFCENGNRVDLLVVPPDTEPGKADTAMVLAASAANVIPAPHIPVANASALSPERALTVGRHEITSML